MLRHIAHAAIMPGRAAALLGTKEIGFTIVSITASLLAVFIPILLMGGMVGPLFREFAVTLSIAIRTSALVSLTLTPMMGSQLLRRDGDRPAGRLARTAERGFDAGHALYTRSLDWILRHQFAALLLTLATVAFTVVLYVVIPNGLFPQQDTGFLLGATAAAQDVSFPATKTYQEEVNAIVGADPDVEHVVSFIGSANASTGNTGTLFISLKSSQRKVTADQVISRLRPKIAALPGIRLFLQMPGALPLAVGGGVGSELRRPLGLAIVGGLLLS
jgi:multidrug efflux pump subunit AcrB